MRTPRLESVNSGETSGQICEAGRFLSISARRSAPSDRDRARPLLRQVMLEDEGCGASSLSALARARSRRAVIRRHDRQKRGRIRLFRPCGVEGLAVALEAFSIRPVPAFDGRRRP